MFHDNARKLIHLIIALQKGSQFSDCISVGRHDTNRLVWQAATNHWWEIKLESNGWSWSLTTLLRVCAVIRSIRHLSDSLAPGGPGSGFYGWWWCYAKGSPTTLGMGARIDRILLPTGLWVAGFFPMLVLHHLITNPVASSFSTFIM